jgi:hypothetical protein
MPDPVGAVHEPPYPGTMIGAIRELPLRKKIIADIYVSVPPDGGKHEPPYPGIMLGAIHELPLRGEK